MGIPVIGLPKSLGLDSADSNIRHVGARLHQQIPDVKLGFQVGALADVVEADDTFLVNQVLAGPVAVLVSTPRPEVVVHGHGPNDFEPGQGLAHVFLVLFELELGRVDTYYHQATVGVLAVPVPYIRQGTLAVNSSVSPEVDQDDFAPLVLHSKRLAVQPLYYSAKFWGLFRACGGDNGRRGCWGGCRRGAGLDPVGFRYFGGNRVFLIGGRRGYDPEDSYQDDNDSDRRS